MEKQYYYVSQFNYGHEYVWIFDKEGLRNTPAYEAIKNLDAIESACIDIRWPIGGSNSSSTWIVKCIDKQHAKTMLTKTANGPDLEDPQLIDIAEYLCTVETDCGSCTQEILDEYNLKANELTQTDSRYDELIELGVKPEDFYHDMASVRYSEVEKQLKER